MTYYKSIMEKVWALEAELEESRKRERRLREGITEHHKHDDLVGSFESRDVIGGSTFEAEDMQIIEDANERLWSLLDNDTEDHHMTDDELADIDKRLWSGGAILTKDILALLAEVKVSAGELRLITALYKVEMAENKRLREALLPLVAQLDDWHTCVPDDLDVYTAPAGEHWGLDEAIREGGWEPAYTIGDLRRARSLLDNMENDDERV